MKQQVIDKFMTQVYADFLKSIAERGSLHQLKALQFYDKKRPPPYAASMVQQYYLLRFFPAYLFEYYHIYRQILQADLLDAPLDILSIGAGCGLDYLGLHYALQRHKKYRTGFNYRGVDAVTWNYQWGKGKENVQYSEANVTSYNVFPSDSCNVIFFPHSLTELDEEKEFCHIRKLLARSVFNHGMLCLGTAYNDKDKELAVRRLNEMAAALEKSGWKFLEMRLTDVEFLRERPSPPLIADQARDRYSLACDYPADILDSLRQLPSRCPTYIAAGQRHCRHNCCKELDRNEPIHSTRHIRFRMLFLKRQKSGRN